MKLIKLYITLAIALISCEKNYNSEEGSPIKSFDQAKNQKIITKSSFENIHELRQSGLILNKDTSYTSVDTLATKEDDRWKIYDSQIEFDPTLENEEDSTILLEYEMTLEQNDKPNNEFTLQFVSSFRNDQVKIQIKDSTIWKDSVNTRWNTGYAQSIPINRSVKEVTLEINDSLSTQLHLPEEYNYLYIHSRGVHDTLSLIYTYLPKDAALKIMLTSGHDIMRL